jgi:hypothetical protein
MYQSKGVGGTRFADVSKEWSCGGHVMQLYEMREVGGRKSWRVAIEELGVPGPRNMLARLNNKVNK